MSDNIQTYRRPNGTLLPGHPMGKQPGQVSIIGHIKKVCEQNGFDWAQEAINRFRDPTVPHSDRTACLQMIADRIAPKLKAIEVRASEASAMQQVLINVIAGTQPMVTSDKAPLQTLFLDDTTDSGLKSIDREREGPLYEEL